MENSIGKETPAYEMWKTWKLNQREKEIAYEMWKNYWAKTAAKTARSYAEPLTSCGSVTQRLREAGILSEEEAVITLGDKNKVPHIRVWWEQEGKATFAKNRPALRGMNTWLNINEKPVDGQTPPVKEKTVVTLKPVLLRPPTHGVRPRFVIDAFVAELSDSKKGSEIEIDVLLQILTGKEWKKLLEAPDYREYMREHTRKFQSIRQKILSMIDEKYSVLKSNLLHSYEDPALLRACRGLVTRGLNQHGEAILKDLSQRSLTFEDSILERLTRLGKAAQEENVSECVDGFLSLLQLTLIDCDPGTMIFDIAREPGQALRADEFWKNSQLLNWLNQYTLQPETLNILLKFTPSGESAEYPCFYLFRGMRALIDRNKKSTEQQGKETAEEWAGKAMVYLQLHWDQLRDSLQREWDGWNAVPEARLIGKDNRHDCTMFWAMLLVEQAELAVECAPGSRDRSAGAYRLMTAMENVRQAEKILRERVEAGLRMEEELAGRYDLHVLWVRLYLCRAECYYLLSLQEEEENCLEDAIVSYMQTARQALLQTEARLKDVPPEYGNEWKSRLDRQRDACLKTFFDKNSKVLKRMGYRSRSNRSLYRQEREQWKKRLWTPDIQIVVPRSFSQLKPEMLRSADSFDTVYCGVFDSIPGKNRDYKETMELQFFQMLASGKVCLLQMNQIVDNWAMLNLVPTAGFRQACRDGNVTLSCYGSLNNPKKYLINALNDPEYKFSSTEMYKLPKGADEDTINKSLRGVMLKYLETEDKGYIREQIPYEWREQAEFLIDVYAILFECFQPSDLLRFHQNPDMRTPPASMPHGGPQLNQVVSVRLKQLLYEAETFDATKNLETLRAMQEYTRRWPDLTNRSLYHECIDQKLCYAGKEETYLLQKFKKLVDQSYFLSNGHRSCDTVLLTETDPDLIRTGELVKEESASADTLTRILRQNRRPASDSNLSWPDLCRVALIVREINEKERGISLHESALLKEKYTGLRYSVVGQEAIANDLSPKTSDGNTYHIVEADKGAEVLEMHRAGQ